MMEKIKVVLYGVGAVSSMIAENLLEKEGVEITGAVEIAQDKVGKDLGDALFLGRKLGVKISSNVDEVLSETKPDIAVHATSSFLKNTYPQITSIAKHGVNVISTCEELVYPYRNNKGLSRKLDALAMKHDVTILGTGINPGFLMDALVIMLTAPCQRIDKICVIRMMDAATRRLSFQKKIGAGLTVDEFQTQILAKQISGHVGLKQSIAMIADALCWKLDRIEVETIKPMIAKKNVTSKDMKIKAGKVSGLTQKAKGIIAGKEAITLDFRACIGAKIEYDQVTIEGVPAIRQRIQPCIHGDAGTVAMIVNSIPRVLNAPAGLISMKDLPLPSATLGDIRMQVRN